MRNNSLSRAELNYESGAVKNIHYGDILVRFDSVVSYENEMIPYVNDSVEIDFSSHLLQDGDIIFADAAEDETVGKAVEITGIKDNKIVAGLHTIACRPTKKVEPLYLGYYLNSNAYHDQLLPIMQGTKVNSISRNSIAKTEILLPESADEQKAIGSFFSTLDHTITFHQRESLTNLYFNLSVRVSALLGRHLDFQALELYADMFSVLWSCLRVPIAWLR